VKTYKVYCGQRYIGTYRAKDGTSAIKQAQNNQTGNAKHLYKAQEL